MASPPLSTGTTRQRLRSQNLSFVLSAVPPPGQYSVAKFLDLHAYIHRTSPWRAALVIVATPLPGLIAALIPAFLPLQPLRHGATAAAYAHFFFIIFFVTSGAVASTLVVTDVPTAAYSLREVLLVSLVCGIIHLLAVYPLCSHWRFPVPFFFVIGACIWSLNCSVAHVLVLRKKCWQLPELARAFRLYGLGLLLQITQVVIYPAISVLFDHVDGGYQLALTLCFPLVKIVMKRALRFVTRRLKDQHGVVVVAAVEICSSMYQSMIMQSAPSTVAIVVIMAIDVLQGALSIKYFLDRPSHVPRNKLISEALAAIQKRGASRSKQSKTHAALVIPSPAPEMFVATSPRTIATTKVGPSCTDIKRDTRTETRNVERQLLIRQALQVTHVAESILLVEYFEVMVPLLNCVFLIVAAQFRSAFYNTKLCVFYKKPTRLLDAVASILLYSLLQGLSYVAMHIVMRYRYGLSATYHLAFVLERHRVPIQGKLVAWLPVILHFTSAHYGTDFSFTFDFQSWDQWQY